MVTIKIHQQEDSANDMAHCLRHIAKLIEEGYTSGCGPSWELEGEDEPEEDEPEEDEK